MHHGPTHRHPQWLDYKYGSIFQLMKMHSGLGSWNSAKDCKCKKILITYWALFKLRLLRMNTHGCLTRWGGLWGLVPDLEIRYKTAKPEGTRVELIFSIKISTGFAEARQLFKAMQADDGEEASQPSSPTAASGSQSCLTCAGLIPRDWPRRFQHCRMGWPTTEEAASTWGEME